jgi:hypothetical protein
MNDKKYLSLTTTEKERKKKMAGQYGPSNQMLTCTSYKHSEVALTSIASFNVTNHPKTMEELQAMFHFILQNIAVDHYHLRRDDELMILLKGNDKCFAVPLRPLHEHTAETILGRITGLSSAMTFKIDSIDLVWKNTPMVIQRGGGCRIQKCRHNEQPTRIDYRTG